MIPIDFMTKAKGEEFEYFHLEKPLIRSFIFRSLHVNKFQEREGMNEKNRIKLRHRC